MKNGTPCTPFSKKPNIWSSGFDAAHADAHDDADAIAVRVIDRQPRLVHRHLRGSERVLDEAIGPLALLAIHVDARVEVAHLGGDADRKR